LVFHALNRAVARQTIFREPADYDALIRILRAVRERVSMRVLAYCVMPNHWHLVLWPRCDGDLSEFLRLLTVTHVQRWHAAHGSSGTGSLYQGRFKSFPVQTDEHFLTVCRYVERNPVRAGLVTRAEDWPWSSAAKACNAESSLDEWPLPAPPEWKTWVNKPLRDAERAALRRSVAAGTPFGNDRWRRSVAQTLGLGSSLRSRGRPRSARCESSAAD
jgi:putative transposase